MTRLRTPPLPRIPDQDAIRNTAQRELQRLWNEIEYLWLRLWRGEHVDDELHATLRQIAELGGDARAAARVAGLISPWAEDIATLNLSLPGESSTSPLLPIPSDGPLRFPWIERAVEFLSNKQVVTWDEFRRLSREDKLAVFHVPEVNDEQLAKEIRSVTRDSLNTGESFANFLKKVREKLELRRFQHETIYRTNIHQSYVDGQEETFKNSVIQRAFPYVRFVTSKDGRVRPEHKALEGLVVSRDDTAYELFRKALNDWNCRCSLIPLNRQRAESMGIDTLADVPFTVRIKYGF